MWHSFVAKPVSLNRPLGLDFYLRLLLLLRAWVNLNSPLTLTCVNQCMGMILTFPYGMSISDTTIARHIDEMASDVRVQLIEKLRLADAFALQLDESTDVFVRFVNQKEMQEEFCKRLPELGLPTFYPRKTRWEGGGCQEKNAIVTAYMTLCIGSPEPYILTYFLHG